MSEEMNINQDTMISANDTDNDLNSRFDDLYVLLVQMINNVNSYTQQFQKEIINSNEIYNSVNNTIGYTLFPLSNSLIDFYEKLEQKVLVSKMLGLSGKVIIENVNDLLTDISKLVEETGLSVHGDNYYYGFEQVYPNTEFRKEPIERLQIDNVPSIPTELEFDIGTINESNMVESVKLMMDKVNQFMQYSSAINQNNVLMSKQLKYTQSVVDTMMFHPYFVKLIELKKTVNAECDNIKAYNNDYRVEHRNMQMMYIEMLKNTMDRAVLLLNCLDIGVVVKLRTYNPEHHEITSYTSTKDSDDLKDNKIARYFSNCFVQNGKVLRKAKVQIYKTV